MREYDEEAYLYNIEGQDEDDSNLDVGVVAEGEVWISWDSGADDHVAPTWFGEGPLEPTKSQLRDING
eukprot:9150337-Heterocapsa_arctica.AAC.1